MSDNTTPMIASDPSRAAKREHRVASVAVKATGLTVVYGRVPVLCDIDLEIAEGQCVAVVGPNGAGKSTLLKCLAGAVHPAVGSVNRFGQATAPCCRTRRYIGFVGQETGLYAELTAMENLLFAGRMYGIANVRNRAAKMLADGGLGPQAHRPVGQLSQGMRQRMAILRAEVHEPRLLILDEPSAKLDAQGHHWLEQLFQQWRSAGRTVCLASHDATLCRAVADWIAHLDAGRIVATERRGDPTIEMRRSA